MVRRRRFALEATYAVALTICFLPCICAIGGVVILKDVCRSIKRYERPKTKMRKREAAREKEIWRTSTRCLGPRLERHLTIGREGLIDEEKIISGKQEGGIVNVRHENQKGNAVVKGEHPGGRTDDQLESPLFKLPRELRNQIWEDVLGGYVFHIYFVQAYRRMGHTRCKTRVPEICKGGDIFQGFCRQQFKVPGVQDSWGNSNLLSLLQSCRRTYSEGISMLYQKNTFDFDSLGDVLKLSYTLLPERMRLIRDVQWKPLPISNTYCHEEYMPWLDCQAPGFCRCIDHWKPGMDPSMFYFGDWQAFR